ncbi:MAG: hypothetical protein J2P32_04725 [Actinobacteria bacterium]|nr:hypothetical protein [Actinomycetota bacterium]
MRRFFKDDDFDYLLQIALGSVYHRAADAGEVLATAERIRDGHPRSWTAEWTATADRLAGAAAASEAAGWPGIAARQFLRASLYYSVASYAADGTGDPALFGKLWDRHRDAWDRFVDLAGPAGLAGLAAERVAIPYQGTTLPGYFFRSGAADEPRRTLIYNNGSDGPVTDAWTQAIADALANGWNGLAFDGPGQNAALLRQGLGFRPDWENVITPVVDYLLTRPDVDPEKIGLLGVSQGGYWVPRAAAFEHRIAAAVADPGVTDVSSTILRHLPGHLIKLLDAGEQRKFDQDLATGLKFSASTRALLAFRMRPYRTGSPYEFFAAAREYVLPDQVIAQIRCPVLVTDPEHEQFWPGQSRQLYDKLPGEKALISFTEAEGADRHCEPAGLAIRGERIFGWLDQHVPATEPSISVTTFPPHEGEKS